MCDPVTIAGATLTALSTGMNMAADAKVQRARDDAMAAESIRQRGFDKETSVLNDQSRDRFEGIEGQTEQRAGDLASQFQQPLAPTEQAGSILPSGGSDIVVNEEAKQRGEARDFTDQQGAALGDLRSFGDLLGGINREFARDAGEIGQIGGFKRGSSGVLGLELEDANSKGAGLRLLGDLTGAAGNIGVSAGLGGAKLPNIFGGGGATPTNSGPGKLYFPGGA